MVYIVQCIQLGTDNNIFKSKIRIVSRREESATLHSYGYGTGYAISGPQLISTKFFVHIWSLTNWVFLETVYTVHCTVCIYIVQRTILLHYT